jgi:hypothetical protein
MPRFFAVTALAHSTGAAREVGDRSLMGRGPSSRWLLTPCALRLGEPHRYGETSDVLVVAQAVLPRELLTPAFAAYPACLSASVVASRRAEGPAYRRGFSTTAFRDPGRLPSAWCSVLRPSEAGARSLFVRAQSPRTLVARHQEARLVRD